MAQNFDELVKIRQICQYFPPIKDLHRTAVTLYISYHFIP